MVAQTADNTILFAYGDGSFQKFVAALLASIRCNVITAHSGPGAIERSRSFTGKIRLILAGIDMPEMTGMELAIQLSRERPGTGILLLSELDSGILVMDAGWQFLPKRFMADLLREKIRGFLGDGQTRGETAPSLSDMGSVVSERSRAAQTILVAENRGARQSAATSLRSAGCRLIAASSGTDAVQRAGEFKGGIQMLLSTVDLPDMTGIELLRLLIRERPRAKTLLFSTLDSGTLILSRGWHFLPGPFEKEMFSGIVTQRLADSELFIEKSAASDELTPGRNRLTSREIQMLKLIALGQSTKQAAAHLGIAFKTAVGHRSSLMKKLDIHDTAALVRYAIRAGLVEL